LKYKNKKQFKIFSYAKTAKFIYGTQFKKVMVSSFRAAIDFFGEIGIYDVILPFLLVFTLVFAILEKTKVLGFEGPEGTEKKYTRKNLNSMVAFVTAFLVVGSSKLVGIINQTISQVFILILISVLFLVVMGIFLGDKEMKFDKKDGWFIFFAVVMLSAIVIIFLNAITNDAGQSWLSIIWGYASNNMNGAIVGAVLMILVVVGMMYYVVKPYDPSKKEDKKE
jgi:hypothetical protein